jgi:hypothetical protein
MILGGLYATLIGFKIIKLKVKPVDQKKMDEWFQKFGTLMKVSGIAMIVFGLFLLATLIFNLGN